MLYNVKHEASPLPTGVSNKNMHTQNYVMGFSLYYGEHISLISIIIIIIIIIIILITIFIIVVIIIINIIIITFFIK